MIDIRQLSCFVAAYHLRNISKAAEQLYVSQQAVSHSIRAFESALGAPLFSRIAGGVVPTELGEALIEDAEKILESCYAFDKKSEVLARKDANAVYLAFSDGIFSVTDSVDLDSMTNYCRQQLGIDIHLMERTSDELLHLIESRQADLICAFGIRPSDISVTKTLKEYPLFVAMGPDHPLANRPILTAAALEQFQVIADPRDDNLNHDMVHLLENNGINIRSYCPSVQHSSFAQTMRRDNSVLIFTRPFLETYAGSDAVIRPLPIKAKLPLRASYRKNHSKAKKLDKIIDFLIDHYQR